MESLHVSQGSGQESHLETPTGQASGSQRPSCREEGTGLSRPPKGSQHIPHAKRKTEKPGLQFLRPLLCCPGSDSVTTRPQGGAGVHGVRTPQARPEEAQLCSPAGARHSALLPAPLLLTRSEVHLPPEKARPRVWHTVGSPLLAHRWTPQLSSAPLQR